MSVLYRLSNLWHSVVEALSELRYKIGPGYEAVAITNISKSANSFEYGYWAEDKG
jgi:hypothetical protein